MPRRARIVVPGIPWHIIQRGNNRSACFYADADYSYYLTTLDEQARKWACEVHAYVLMTNHVHLLVTPHKKNSAAQLMKHLGPEQVAAIRQATNGNYALGDIRFQEEIARMLQRRVVAGKSGRPAKKRNRKGDD